MLWGCSLVDVVGLMLWVWCFGCLWCGVDVVGVRGVGLMLWVVRQVIRCPLVQVRKVSDGDGFNECLDFLFNYAMSLSKHECFDLTMPGELKSLVWINHSPPIDSSPETLPLAVPAFVALSLGVRYSWRNYTNGAYLSFWCR